MKPSPPSTDVKFFVACLHRDDRVFASLRERVVSAFGHVDYQSRPFPFEHTGYYAEEMGTHLVRQFLSLGEARHPSFLVKLKQACRVLEGEFSVQGKRTVNLDPGYLDAQKVVLASFKHGPWKLYLAGGTWGDLTLHYREGRFHSLPWTYPDFRGGTYDKVLLHIRGLWKTPRTVSRPEQFS